MSEVRKTGKKWRRAALVLALVVVAVPVAIVEMLWSGRADNYLRRAVVAELVRMTGGAVELRELHFHPWRLLVTLDDLTIHGREPSGTPPFFQVDHVAVQLRIDSFWRRKISLGDVEVRRPVIHVRIEPDGSTNVPAPRPRAPSGTPFRQRVFDVVARHVRLEDGHVLFNQVRIPLVAEGGRLELALDYSDAQGRPMYLGDFRWQQMQVVARRYLPFSADLTARFTLEPDSFSVTQLVWSMPHTQVDGQLSLSDFAHPTWSFRYRGRLDFEDIRTIMRKPNSPSGRSDFQGNGEYADGKLAVSGQYSAQDIALRFDWFHAGGMSSRGTYRADRKGFEIPDFEARALGGSVNGRVRLDFDGLRFRADTRTRSMHLPALLAAVDNPRLPVLPLHWTGSVDLEATTTWTADFKNVESQGVSLWEPVLEPQAGEIPVMARFNYHYSMLARSVSLESSEISTPTSRMQFNGVLGARATAINAVFDSQDLEPWDDFINRLRGRDADPKIIAGSAHWQGQITGPLSGPTFAGHVKGSNARYDHLYWDAVEGDMSYSPEGFRLVRASASRGGSSAQFELSLILEKWRFRPENAFSLDVTLVRTETDGLQALLGTSYPVHGVLSGNFHATGTRADPQMRGLFDIIAPEGWGWRFDRARGEIATDRSEVRVSNAELRLLPPPRQNGVQIAPAGVLTGNFRYGIRNRQTAFRLTGAVLPLEGIARIQTSRLPVGGRLSFQLNGQGPLLAPKLEGSLRLVDLQLGSDVIGSFDGRLDSDGRQLTLQLDSAMSAGALKGQVEVALSGDYPIAGQISITQLDLDSLISSVLRLTALTGHSRVDGEFNISGALLRPDTLAVQGNLSRITFDYAYVRLENNGPVRFEYRGDEIRVEQASFRGTESDFRITGLARFAGDRRLDLNVAGAVDLQLLGGFVPNLVASGPAQIDAAIAGSLADPQITGRARLDRASVRYGDFPAGLSQVTGNFIFNAAGLVFDGVAAEVGGGRLQLSGSASYASRPPRYDITARADQVRIRYPVGMSWHADGTLRLSGTAQAATLSGRVAVDRLLLSEGVDIVSLLGPAVEVVAAPEVTSPFLRNLELDVQGNTTPNARLEWASGRVQIDANVRLRGTWQRPILLGNIHLLDGVMEFRGNRYQLSRGDINFSNPFRLEPVLNMQAVTRIRQYEVTVNFSGPAGRLTMSYRSDPPLPSGDVITLLALGQTGEESRLRGLTAVQTPELGATTLLSEAISSQLGGRIQRLFGISHFSVDPFLAGTTTEQNPAARVTIEQQFSPNLTVTYITNVTSTQQQVIQIEYSVRRDVSVVALRDENGTFGIDFVFRKHFK